MTVYIGRGHDLPRYEIKDGKLVSTTAEEPSTVYEAHESSDESEK